MTTLSPAKGLLACLLLLINTSAATEWEPPRTADGRPDLQGIWDNRTQTPLERPVDFGTRQALTEEEVQQLLSAALQAEADKTLPLDPERGAPPAGQRIGQEANDGFIETRIGITRIRGEYRSSLIIDPPDGRLPYAEHGRMADIYGQWRAQGFGPSDGPEIRTPADRCLRIGGQLPPMVVTFYNSNFQLVQTENYLMMLSEMVNDARIIRINGKHQPAELHKWMGDSIAHWEGDTLVVQSRHFHPQASNFRIRSSDALEVTEHLTMVSDDEILYRYTVVDPKVYSQPFTAELMLNRRPEGERIYEFACHEGNYSMPAILIGARREEQ